MTAAALKTLMEHYGEAVWNYAYYLARNRSAADDIARETGAALSFPSSKDGDAEVSVPLAAMISIPVLDDGSSPVYDTLPPLPKMTFPLPADMEGKLEAALVFRADTGSAYMLLVPAGWKASAVTGVNGSYATALEDPADPQQRLDYSDNAWGCTGCATGSIGTYFPGKAGWAEQQGFTVIPPAFTRQYVAGTEGADARTVRYSLAAEAKDYQTEGTAYYEEGEWGYLFRQLELTSSSGSAGQDAAVLETILSFFTANSGPLILPAAGNTEAGAEQPGGRKPAVQ
ncbi:DUF4850 domain-containing protein [Paenibacillus sp. S150]|uniref:DUF4850 domain-containing protein n=1 Tax=Paenibacillus sp. S150 TaxID=2749826 RepID=UPI001C573950|nr:DUF4850 domain-containing protein [Paenibacillus sp. S150]MBW4082673.1 DUF4850 domain-containing protein [Paenibacillus sp. S150]